MLTEIALLDGFVGSVAKAMLMSIISSLKPRHGYPMISFKQRHFKKEMILMLVRWYVAYPMSYRDIEELAAERNLKVDHSTALFLNPQQCLLSQNLGGSTAFWPTLSN